MIRLEHVRKVYPNVTPLKDVSTEINNGDVISVLTSFKGVTFG